MSNELRPYDRELEFNRVVEAMLKGENPTTTAKLLGIKRSSVLNYIEEWKSIARNDDNVKERAKELLIGMDRSYDMVIQRLWETVEQADDKGDVRTKSSTLKMIAEVLAKRQETLRNAGLYDDSSMGEHYAMIEQESQKVQALLVEVTHKYPDAKAFIVRRLSEIFNKPVGVDEGSGPVS